MKTEPIPPISINHELKHHASEMKIQREQQKEITIKAMDELLAINLAIAAIIEKSSRFHKQDLFGFWGDIFTPQEVKDSMRLKVINPKRDYRTDKLQMELIGLYKRREQNQEYERQAASKPSALSYMMKISINLVKEIQERPVCEWSSNEKHRFTALCAPIAKVLREIDNE